MIEHENTPIPYNMTRIGTCSECGGRVCMPHLWGGVVPPIPVCLDCGAIKKQVDTKKDVRYPIVDMD